MAKPTKATAALPAGFVAILAPEGCTSCSFGGVTYEIQEDGSSIVPAAAVAELRGHGFTAIAPEVELDTGAIDHEAADNPSPGLITGAIAHEEQPAPEPVVEPPADPVVEPAPVTDPPAEPPAPVVEPAPEPVVEPPAE
jgi:outer membrane biosynthesis protein TonB